MASQNGTKHATDPAAVVPGAPPNLGEPVMPHVMSFAGIVSNLAKVYRPSDEAVMDNLANARFMRNDPVIMECVEARQRCGALLDWHIEPEDEKDANQKAVADEVTRVIESMPRFMQYRETLANATFFGKYGASHTWRKKMVRRQMRTAVTKWTPIHGDKIVFRFDDARKVFDDSHIGIRCGIGITAGSQIGQDWQAESMGGGGGPGGMMPTDQGMAYFLPKWQRSLIAIHKHQIEDGEFEAPQYAGRIHGVGIRSRIYWLWYQKQETLAWLMEYLERSAAGFEIWYYQWGNPESEAKARKAAQERIGNRNVVLVPKVLGDEGGMGQWYERIEPSMAGAEAMKSIVIEYFGQLIKRYILGQTLTTEAAGTGLGSNLADVHMDTFMQIVKYDCRLLEETVTDDLVKHIIRYNFPAWVNYDFKFKIKTEEDDVQEKLEACKTAYEMGAEIPAKHVMDLISCPPVEQGEKVLSMAQAQGAGQPGMGQPAAQNGAAGAGGLPPGMTARFGADLANRLGEALQTTGPAIGSANGSSAGTAITGNGVDTGSAQGETYAAQPIDANSFDRAAFRRGLAAEMKETKDHTLASEIVLDNLQRDPRHYDMQALMAQTGDGLFTPPSQDSERSRLATYAKFEESEHPRDDDGTFAEKVKKFSVKKMRPHETLEEHKLEGGKSMGWKTNAGTSFAVVDHEGNPVRRYHYKTGKFEGEFELYPQKGTAEKVLASLQNPESLIHKEHAKRYGEARKPATEDRLAGEISRKKDELRRRETSQGTDHDVHKMTRLREEISNLEQRLEKRETREESFALENKTPRPAGQKFENLGGKQQNMFHGMNDLPGQKNLFEGLDLTSKKELFARRRAGIAEKFSKQLTEALCN